MNPELESLIDIILEAGQDENVWIGINAAKHIAEKVLEREWEGGVA